MHLRSCRTVVRWLLVLFCAVSQHAYAQFGGSWVSTDCSDSLRHVYMRRMYVDSDAPEFAQINVACSAPFRLYVNGCNVGTARFFVTPASADGRSSEAITVDITPYLQPDTNVVALCLSEGTARLSLRYMGVTVGGRPFCHVSDSSWLWMPAPSGSLPGGGEWLDGTRYFSEWLQTDCRAALWRNVAAVACPQRYEVSARTVWGNGVTEEVWPHYFDVTADSVRYDFGTAVWGFPRITIRDAAYGMCIRYGNNVYICRGEMDEQAFPLFAASGMRGLAVAGTGSFRREFLAEVELLSCRSVRYIHPW